jgi:translation initiation factor IF-2
MIAGCMVTEGIIKRNHHIRVVRNKNVIWKGTIASLKKVKEDVREVSKGYECGILLHNFSDVKDGDIVQSYEITYLEQELE